MYLALPVSSGGFTRAIHVSSYSRIQAKVVIYFAYGAITFWGTASQQFLLYRQFVTLYQINLDARILQPQDPKTLVWAFPFSLAATQGITRVAFYSHEHTREQNATHIVLFSSGY